MNELFGSKVAGSPATEGHGLKSVAGSGPPSHDWYFRSAAGTPVSLVAEQVPTLVQGGQIRADTLIWREGLAGWLPLRDVPEIACLLATQVNSVVAGNEPGGRKLKSRVLVVSAAACLFLLLAASAVFLVDKYRKSELRLSGFFQAPHIDSHMSSDIPQATGLVVSSATVTDLRSGNLVEVPGSRGTCFALNPKGHLLTNKHVVQEYLRLTRADAGLEELLARQAAAASSRISGFISRRRDMKQRSFM